MKLTLTKIAAAAALAFASSGAMAAPQAFTNDGAANFSMYDSMGGVTGIFDDVSGWVDYDAMTFGVSSASPFFGQLWTASGGTLYNPGTYTVNVNGDGSDATPGNENVTFTVGAGQMGGNIDFAWGPSSGIDVFMVWDLVDNGDGTMNFVSTDFDGDGILGLKMVDGPFQGFSANFNLPGCLCDYYLDPIDPEITPTIPEASTCAMMLAGLGLVGVAAARRRRSTGV